MTRLLPRTFFLPAFLFAFLCINATPALAEDIKPDDSISITLSTEGWVTTKTARVIVSVNAAVSGDTAGSTRDAMVKAVNALSAKPDSEWRLISFNRGQSETGLETWYAQFENRLPESELNGIHEKLKKTSRPGMQLSVGTIDFTPTLAEREAVKASLRKTIMDMANAELKSIQASFPDRGYRIAAISFNGLMPSPAMNPRVMMMKSAAMADMGASDEMEGGGGMETAQRMTQRAQITFAAIAPTTK